MEAIKAFFTNATSFVGEQFGRMSFGVFDALDILIVAVLLYFIFKFIRERRAGKLAAGVLLLILLQAVSAIFDMKALKFLMVNVFQVGLLALIIVFQPELRSVLEKMGGGSIKGLKSIGGDQRDLSAYNSMISAICESACDMSKDKTGALIVIERDTKLGDVIDSGTLLNAETTPFLLKNIFFKSAPLHDGAVVIRGTRIYSAGCFLPLSENPNIIKDLGTRHRAAIGMSENSDALVVVVSEETGSISVALGGELKRNYDYSSLKSELETHLLATSVPAINVFGMKKRTGGSKGAKNDGE